MERFHFQSNQSMWLYYHSHTKPLTEVLLIYTLQGLLHTPQLL